MHGIGAVNLSHDGEVHLSGDKAKLNLAIFASVAQLVEQRTENPRVVGSIPTGGTIYRDLSRFADLAHLVERDLAKVEVAGSSPVIRSIFREVIWLECSNA